MNSGRRGFALSVTPDTAPDERPLRFFLEDRAVEVAAVLDAWVGPDHRYFKVKGDDGDVYILRHDTAADAGS
jgi:hypothetical protein